MKKIIGDDSHTKCLFWIHAANVFSLMRVDPQNPKTNDYFANWKLHF